MDTNRVYLSRSQAAQYLGLSPKTLEVRAHRGGGPAFSKIGKRVIYSRADLDAWVAAHQRTSTSDRGEAQ